MDKPFTRMQAVVGMLMLLLAIFGAWGSITSQYKQDGKDFENHEVRIKRLEDDKKEIKEYIYKVETKVDKVSDQNSQILILLQNKQDRK